MSNPNRDELAKDFAWLVLLAKLDTEAAVKKFAVAEWKRAKSWVASDSEQPGSFIWACDLFNLEPDAVRRAIRDRKK